MRTNGESKVSFLLLGLVLGAVGGLMAALLASKGTRDLLRERGTRTLDYLNQRGKKLRDTSEGILEKGKELISQRCCSDAESQAHQEERREHLGG